MVQSKIVKIQLVFKMVLAGPKTHVRQTIGFSVRKRAPQHQQIQVKNSLFKIVFWLEKKVGEAIVSTQKPVDQTKNDRRAARQLAQQHPTSTNRVSAGKKK